MSELPLPLPAKLPPRLALAAMRRADVAGVRDFNVRDIVNQVLNLIKTVRDNEMLKYVNGLAAVYVEKHPGNCCVFNAWLWLC